jgi:hypothetical protein
LFWGFFSFLDCWGDGMFCEVEEEEEEEEERQKPLPLL